MQSIENEILRDRFSGCLLGLAAGDSMGRPVDGMTPYEIRTKYHHVDGYFDSPGYKAGDTAVGTKHALETTNALIKASGKIEGIDIPKFSDQDQRHLLARIAPLGLAACGTACDERVLSVACRKIAGEGVSKPDVMGLFVFASMVRECAKDPGSISSPYELYSSDSSLLVRTINTCRKAEKLMDCDFPLSDRLSFVQKKLCAGWDPLTLYGALGQPSDIGGALTATVFMFLRAPDEFSSVCDSVGLGGPAASTVAAAVGALVGAYVGVGAKAFPKDMKDCLSENGKIESIAFALAGCYSGDKEEKKHEYNEPRSDEHAGSQCIALDV